MSDRVLPAGRAVGGGVVAAACLVIVVLGEFEIPAIEAVLAAIRHELACLPEAIFGRLGQQEATAATVDTDDLLRWTNHEPSLPRSLDSMRVVAGELGGRRLVSPDGTATRPTTDRVREAIFNSLGSAGLIDGALVADLYAGSGALGIEALSRGAEHCVFVERDRTALRSLDANLEALDLRSRSKVITSDVLSVANSIDADIVFADPPYEFDEWPRLLELLTVDLVIAESGRSIDPADGWEQRRSKRYGRATVTHLERHRP
jgi:16S rRNA (guanine966-N2)-methyltransferase